MGLRHTDLKRLQRDLGALTVRAGRPNRGAAVPLSRKDRVSDTFVNLAEAVDDALSLLSTLEADPNATSGQRAMGLRLRAQLEALRLTLQMVMQRYRSAGVRSIARKAAAASFDDAVRSAIDALADAYELILSAVRLVPAGAPSNTATQLRAAAERIADMRSLIFNVSAIAQRRGTSALASKQTPAGAFADWWSRVGQYDAQDICRRSQAAELHQPGVLADIRRWCEGAFQQGAENRPHTAMGSWPDPALDDLEEDAYQAGRRYRSLPPYA